MEYFDLIDEKDTVIGITTKRKSHNNALLHRIVAVFVFSPNGELLVQKRLDDHKLDHSIGGHVSKGETYNRAVIREAEEELNIRQKPKKLCVFLSDETGRGKNVKHMIALYEFTVPQTWEFSQTKEVKSLIPMTLDKLSKEMKKHPEKFSMGFLNTFRKYSDIKNLKYFS